MRFKANDNLIEYSNIEVFNMVRSGSLYHFPRGFWDGSNNLNDAKEITKHLFENILNWSIEDIKSNPLSDVFHSNRLGGMVKIVFGNSIYRALLNAYPELEEWINIKKQEETDRVPFARFTDEELIEKLQEKTKELGRIPYGRELSNPEISTYSNRFGSWERSLIAAELMEDIFANIDDSKEKRDEAKKMLKEFVLKRDRLPTDDEISEMLSIGELRTYFNTVSGLYTFLENEYTEQELIDILKYKKEILGRVPLRKDMKVPRAIMYVEKFGSWEKALTEANLS